eukprot:TRINITY_DN24031_c0_g1_i1.p1 TRINITY_DN24031_c0_g1~~TRINITY_DN24031_c0_g1_i1.p1  ORF type:complete len:431 (+),score=126.01 TRINITY_DN24031_c0_g1_i1:106-1398(+)
MMGRLNPFASSFEPRRGGDSVVPETPQASPRDSCTAEQLSTAEDTLAEQTEASPPPAVVPQRVAAAVPPQVQSQSPASTTSSPGPSDASSAPGDALSEIGLMPGSWCQRFSSTTSSGAIVVRTPWYPNGITKAGLKLAAEMVDFHAFLCPSDRERAGRLTARSLAHDAASALWPQATVKAVANATGFAAAAPVVDLVVENCPGSLWELAEALRGFDGRVQVQSICGEETGEPRLDFTAGGVRASVWTCRGGSELRRTASQANAALARWPAAAPVAAVVRTILEQARCGDPHSGGLSPYAQQVMVLHCCARSRNAADPGVVLKEFFSYFASFNYGEHAVAPFGPQSTPKVATELNQAVVVRDPADPGRNLAVGCTRLVQMQQQFKYCQQSLSKWAASSNSRRGYKGRTPLSTIVSLQPLWARTEALGGPSS